MAAGPRPVHLGQEAVLVVFRVVRRFGAEPVSAASPVGASPAAASTVGEVASAVAAFGRLARRLGAAACEVSSPVDEAVAFRVVRRFGVADPAASPSGATSALAVVGAFRVVRRLGADVEAAVRGEVMSLPPTSRTTASASTASIVLAFDDGATSDGRDVFWPT